MLSAKQVIAKLKLEPHPIEGGFFRETYRTTGTAPGMPRSLSTAIYYLLMPGHVSELHILPGDEVFHFYLGEPVEMLQLWPDGTGKRIMLGSDIAAGHEPQVVVPGGVWQGTRLVGTEGFALLGATMAPGFDYADYTSARRAELLAQWPDFAEQIEPLTPRG